MININLLKPTSANFQTYLYIGSGLIFISIFDVILRSFFNINNWNGSIRSCITCFETII